LSLPLRRSFATSDDGSKQQDQKKTILTAVGLLGGLVGGYAIYQSLGETKDVAKEEAAPAAKAAATTAPPLLALNKDEFREFELVDVEDLTPNTRRLRFKLPSGDHVLGLPVASCVVTKANIGTATAPLH
jgi:hypothetical protein